jgi:hypothetical protein
MTDGMVSLSNHELNVFAVICHSGLSGLRLIENLSDGLKEGFPTRFTCGNDSLPGF